jgi:hypothetical protein
VDAVPERDMLARLSGEIETFGAGQVRLGLLAAYVKREC